MAGESPSLKQEDIEELLRQAQMASGLVPEGAPPPTPPRLRRRSSRLRRAATAAAQPPRRPRPRRSSRRDRRYTPRPAAGSSVGDDVQFLLAQAEQAIASVDAARRTGARRPGPV